MEGQRSQQEVPGFLVEAVAGVGAVGGEPDVEGAREGGDRDDVPGIGGDDVGGDEIDLVGGVGAATVADRAHVGLQPLLAGAFDLHAVDASVALHEDVVGSGIAPGFRGHEAVLGGAGHEAEFGPLAAQLAVLDRDGWIAHGLRPLKDKKSATRTGRAWLFTLYI
jgi:hypothetical protein